VKNAKRLLMAATVGGIIAIGITYRGDIDRDELLLWFEDLGAWAAVVFIASYALAAVAFLPGLVFTMAGGALFGPFTGTLVSLIGAVTGAGLAFLAARYILGDWVAERTGQRLEPLQAGIDAEGWRFVALVRLVPLFPFNLLNYALGLTRLKFSTYLLTSFAAMAPGALAYAWLGHTGRAALEGQNNLIQTILIAIALLASLAFLPRLIKRFRQDSQQKDKHENS
jgi:uncharacterized membrane protein YdjX (TVP38/TMEM64 family)